MRCSLVILRADLAEIRPFGGAGPSCAALWPLFGQERVQESERGWAHGDGRHDGATMPVMKHFLWGLLTGFVAAVPVGGALAVHWGRRFEEERVAARKAEWLAHDAGCQEDQQERAAATDELIACASARGSSAGCATVADWCCWDDWSLDLLRVIRRPESDACVQLRGGRPDRAILWHTTR
jgi:hypothetical protein